MPAEVGGVGGEGEGEESMLDFELQQSHKVLRRRRIVITLLTCRMRARAAKSSHKRNTCGPGEWGKGGRRGIRPQCTAYDNINLKGGCYIEKNVFRRVVQVERQFR